MYGYEVTAYNTAFNGPSWLNLIHEELLGCSHEPLLPWLDGWTPTSSTLQDVAGALLCGRAKGSFFARCAGCHQQGSSFLCLTSLPFSTSSSAACSSRPSEIVRACCGMGAPTTPGWPCSCWLCCTMAACRTMSTTWRCFEFTWRFALLLCRALRPDAFRALRGGDG